MRFLPPAYASCPGDEVLDAAAATVLADGGILLLEHEAGHGLPTPVPDSMPLPDSIVTWPVVQGVR
eukprot:CAMPEP_0181023890 /NCGR_PEP_ID=MMETSP1070-20121207/2285_1 /TAXON_ID=265543 /ORGANISM="Minutocellus polymorphus, Strain NH13" /LENGTH=65 /DNA_ID=CAMNT_0023100921 /DNA_START=24 /DNA_END=220 /DNA_ORIENTATION=+